ncbi:gamma carbonic anhydrase family protein [Trinickia sp. YCB016]
MKQVDRATTSESSSVDQSVFIAPGATLIGDVTIGGFASIWFNCVLRGDVQRIVIGKRTNIQDATIIHGTTGGNPVIIGDDVTVGHGAILHACTIERGGFVGFGARVLDAAVVKTGGMLAAGSLLTSGKIVGENELWAGNPAKFLRLLTEEERLAMRASSERYVQLANHYRNRKFSIATY